MKHWVKFLAVLALAFMANQSRASIRNVQVTSSTPNSVTIQWQDTIAAAQPGVSYTAGVTTTVGSTCGLTITGYATGAGICMSSQTVIITGLVAGTEYCVVPQDYVCNGQFSYWEPGKAILFTTGATYTPSPTFTSSPSITATFTGSPSITTTSTPTATPSITATSTPSATPTASPAYTHTFTPTLSPTSSTTPTDTPSATRTSTRTSSPTISPTWTSSFTSSPTFTRTPTDTKTTTKTASPTATPSATPTVTTTATKTATATDTRTASPTSTPSPNFTHTWTPTITATPTISPTSTATPVISIPLQGITQERYVFTATGSAQNVTETTQKIQASWMPIVASYVIDQNSSGEAFSSGTGNIGSVLSVDATAFAFQETTTAMTIYSTNTKQLVLQVPASYLTNSHIYTLVVSYLTQN